MVSAATAQDDGQDAAVRGAAGLSRAIEAISGDHELASLPDRIIEGAAGLVQADRGWVGLLESTDGARVIRVAAVQNLPALVVGAVCPADTGLAGRVLAEGHAMRADGSNVDASSAAGFAGGAVAGVPLVCGGQVIGVCIVAAPRGCSDEDMETLARFGRHAGAALHNAREVDALQRSLSTTRLLYETSRRISLAGSVDDVIAAYLNHVAEDSRYFCGVALYEIDGDGQRVGTVVHRRPPTGQGPGIEAVPMPMAAWEGLLDLLDAGVSVTFANVHTDPRAPAELRRRQGIVGRPAVALVPMIAGEARPGFLAMTCPRPHAWREDELRPFQVTAALLATTLVNRQQQALLAERGRQLAVIEERHRLTRELHDSVTQSLVSLNLLTQTLPELWDVDPAEARGSLGQIRDLTRTALTEMRALLFELRDADEHEGGLRGALERCVAFFRERNGTPVTLALDLTAEPPVAVAEAFRRITREALTNVARHAAASAVSVSLTGGDSLRLRIVDDGRGFDPARVRTGSLGLVSMRERAEAIGARLELRSAPGDGTALTVVWPATCGVRAEGGR